MIFTEKSRLDCLIKMFFAALLSPFPFFLLPRFLISVLSFPATINFLMMEAVACVSGDVLRRTSLTLPAGSAGALVSRRAARRSAHTTRSE